MSYYDFLIHLAAFLSASFFSCLLAKTDVLQLSSASLNGLLSVILTAKARAAMSETYIPYSGILRKG